MEEEYSARAAIFRRLAGEMKSEADRSALLAIADQYQAEATALLKRRGAG